MLGLGASLSNEEAYAKGERFRERYHDTEGIYHMLTNPVGRLGIEADYIGDFATSTDDDNYVASKATIAIDGATLKVTSSDTGGSAKIGVSTIPYTSYTLTFDITSLSIGNTGQVTAGNIASTDGYGDTGAINSTGTNNTLTFTPISSYTILVFISLVSGKFAKYDNISLNS